jgi:transposase
MRHLGEALDEVKKTEYARLSGHKRRYIKGQKYTLLSRRENLTVSGKRALKLLLNANKRLNTAYVLKESLDSFGIMSASLGRGSSSTTGGPA